MRQLAHIGHAHGGLGLGAGQEVGDHRLGSGCTGQHLQRQQCRARRRQIVGLCCTRQAQRLRQVAGGQVRTAQRHPAGGAGARLVQIGQHQLFDDGQRALAVGHALQHPRQAGDQTGLLHQRHAGQPGGHRLGGFFGLVQGHQDLGLVAQRCNRARLGIAPGAGSLQRLVAGACLQCNFDRTLVQRLVAVAPGGVQDHTEGVAGTAGIELKLADQQLVEQQRVQR